MAAYGWTHQELLRKLREFEQELRDAGLKESTVRTYVDRSETFLKWLVSTTNRAARTTDAVFARLR